MVDSTEQYCKQLEEVILQNRKMKRALVELDTGGGDYLTVRMKVAELSGLPAMGASFDEHIAAIQKRLEKPHDHNS